MNPPRFLPTGRGSIPFLTLAVVFFLPVASSWANENTAEYDTSVAGQLVPVEETVIQVRREDLKIRFDVVPPEEGIISGFTGIAKISPLRVEVTARYRLFNPSSEDRSLLLAFPIVRGGPEEQRGDVRLQWMLFKNQKLPASTRRGVRCRVAVNGEEIPFDYVSFESLFEKERERWVKGVRQWLAQWPEIAKAVEPEAMPSDKARSTAFGVSFDQMLNTVFMSLVRKANTGEEAERLFHLVARQRLAHARIDEWDLDVLSFLYSATYPNEKDSVAHFQRQWGVEPFFLNPITGERYNIDPLHASDRSHYALSRLNRRIDFLQYRPTLPAGKETSIEVRFSHLVDVDMYHTRPNQGIVEADTYQFQYILKTSPKWKTFGPIRLALEIPCHTAYSISLPVAYKREKEGYDHFTYEVEGTAVRENLLVGLMGINPWGNFGLLGALPGDPYPAEMGVRVTWEKYKADPTGPFADDLLYRMGQRIMAGALKPEEGPWFVRQFQGSHYVPQDSSRREIARAAMWNIPRRYPIRHCDGLLMGYLYAHSNVNEGIVGNLRSHLSHVRTMERSLRLRADDGMTRQELEAKQARLKDAVFMREMETLKEFVRLCDTYLAAYTDPGASREARFKAMIGKAEMEMRLARLPRLDFSLKDRLRFNLNEYLRYWTIYTLYRDLPESAELLRMLAWLRSHPGFFMSNRLWSEDMRLAEDIAKRVDEEVQARGIEIPKKWWKPGAFPDWLGVD